MSQTFTTEIPTGSTNILQDNVNSRNNENTLRSQFSGTVYPDGPVVGQRFFNSATDKEYVYTSEGWVEAGYYNSLQQELIAARGALASLSARLAVGINNDGTLKMDEVEAARGSMTSLASRLSVALNADGTLINEVTANVDEFKVSGFTPTYISSSSFSVPDDRTGIFTTGRIMRITLDGGTEYLPVVSSQYSELNDKTTIVIDGEIDNTISVVDYSLLQYGVPTEYEYVGGIPV